jgi:hypothetical protein
LGKAGGEGSRCDFENIEAHLTARPDHFQLIAYTKNAGCHLFIECPINVHLGFFFADPVPRIAPRVKTELGACDPVCQGLGPGQNKVDLTD